MGHPGIWSLATLPRLDLNRGAFCGGSGVDTVNAHDRGVAGDSPWIGTTQRVFPAMLHQKEGLDSGSGALFADASQEM